MDNILVETKEFEVIISMFNNNNFDYNIFLNSPIKNELYLEYLLLHAIKTKNERSIEIFTIKYLNSQESKPPIFKMAFVLDTPNDIYEYMIRVAQKNVIDYDIKKDFCSALTYKGFSLNKLKSYSSIMKEHGIFLDDTFNEYINYARVFSNNDIKQYIDGL